MNLSSCPTIHSKRSENLDSSFVCYIFINSGKLNKRAGLTKNVEKAEN